MKKIRQEKGYVDTELIGLIVKFIVFLLIIGFIATDMFGNYKVYYKTSQYTQNNQEDYYYIQKEDTELAEQMKEYITEGKEVIVYYDQWVGFKGFTAPSTSPIVRIEEVKDN